MLCGTLMNVSEHYDDYEEQNSTHTNLFPQEGDGGVDALVLNQITGVLMKKKEKHIVHHRSVFDKSLFSDFQKLHTCVSKSIKDHQILRMSTIRTPKDHQKLFASTRRSSTSMIRGHKYDFTQTLIMS